MTGATNRPRLEERLAQVKIELTNTSSAYDAIRKLSPNQFASNFESVMNEFQTYSLMDNQPRIPMLLVPLSVDTDTDTIEEVGETKSYWAAKSGRETTLDREYHSTLIEKYEAIVYLDCRASSPTTRHLRSVLLVDLANQMNQIRKQIHAAEREQGHYSPICGICGDSTTLGYIGISWLSRDESGWGVHFCVKCETEIVELLSSFEPAEHPPRQASFIEIWESQETCSFCKSSFDKKDERAGIEVFKPDDEKTEVVEELYSLCGGCSTVLESFFENIGASTESPQEVMRYRDGDASGC
ncbi:MULTISPECIES: hypothetical protein [unclassified Haloferax]|jgi:hypothetical protein|uniref:hypothetical protein n=1 Tax=unclassified Haloferax TaxID=2625095 RepID=UPI002874BE4D|nr:MULTISPECIES: hypothetical protein [unclassified Haloferax]MDS0243167.1 hypothetical protein [Haloferax sp. S2CR25]MDS0446288.1 hypothetical protein [Haloferax sp. S2CR25-2]